MMETLRTLFNLVSSYEVSSMMHYHLPHVHKQWKSPCCRNLFKHVSMM